MKRLLFLASLLIMLYTGSPSLIAQERFPVREYTNPDERLAMGGETKFFQAMEIFADMYKRFGGKILIYEGHDEKPININIPNMYWRDAFDMVLRVTNYWYDEREAYVKIVPIDASKKADSLNVKAQDAKYIREVEISAIFFETNVNDLKQLGIDWSVLNVAPRETMGPQTKISFGSSGNSASVNDGGLSSTLSTAFKAADITAAIKAITSNNLGEVIANPSVTVRSGEQGRIQVGSDVSVKQKDFAGNLVEKFFATGTIIEVTPTVMTVDSTDFVHLVISAERSSVNPDPNRTVIDKTKANTSVLLLNGEETVIGGLYTNDNRVARRGIPFLKDLPWWVFGIRYLAGYDETSVAKKELVIILKANIIPTLQQRIDMKFAEKDQRELQRKLGQYDQMMKKIRTQIDAPK